MIILYRGENMEQTVSIYDMHKIVNACHSDPFSVLGIHEVTTSCSSSRCFAVRSFMPNARELYLLKEQERYPMNKIHDDGFFEIVLEAKNFFTYKFEISDYAGFTFEIIDPYSFYL